MYASSGSCEKRLIAISSYISNGRFESHSKICVGPSPLKGAESIFSVCIDPSYRQNLFKMPKMLNLICLLHLVLYWTCRALGENASVILSPTIDGQHVLAGSSIESDGLNDAKQAYFYQLTIKKELQKRLSSGSDVHLEGEDSFAALSARYTDYKRPQYIAIVQPAEEKDVIETVSLQLLFLKLALRLINNRSIMHERGESRSPRGRVATASQLLSAGSRTRLASTCVD